MKKTSKQLTPTLEQVTVEHNGQELTFLDGVIQINESHPAKERSGVSTTEMFSAGTLYPVRNDNPKNRDPIKTAPPNATAISLPFDLLSMSGNELGVSGLPKKLLSKISINSKDDKQKA